MRIRNRINLVFYLLTGMLALWCLIAIPGVDSAFQETLGWTFPKTLAQTIVTRGALILNVYGVLLAIFLVNFTIGFTRGMWREIGDSWRRIPMTLRSLLLIFGMVVLALNLAAAIWFLLQNMEGFSELYQVLQKHIPEPVQAWLGSLTTASTNFLFTVSLALTVVAGHLKAPVWKRIRVPADFPDETRIGLSSVRLTPGERKKLRKAEHFIEKGKLLKAARLFEELGREFHYRAGKFYSQKGHEVKAAKAFGKAGEFYLKQANYPRAADSFYFGGHWQRAAETYEHFLPKETGRGDRQRLLQWVGRWGHALYRLEAFEKAGRLYLEHKLYKKAGEAFERGGMATEAADAYGKAGAFESSYKALSESGYADLAQMEKAKFYLMRGEHIKAAEVFEKNGKFKDAADAYQQANLPGRAARSLMLAGELENAVEAFLAAGEDERALDCYEKMGDYLKAAQLASHLGMQDKQALFYEKGGLMIPAARAYLMIGETGQAVSCLKKLAVQDAATAEQCAGILTVLTQQNRLKEGLACARGLLSGKKPEPVLAPLYFALGKIYQKLDNLQEACHCFIKAAHFQPTNEVYVADARDLAQKTGQTFSFDTQPPATEEPTTRPDSSKQKAKNKRPKPAHDPDEQDNTLTLDEQTVFDITQDGALQRYQVICELGRGGMGFVYKARDKKLKRLVALKMLYPEHNREPRVVLFFKREARAVASLNHPNLVHLFDAGMEKGCFYMIMEFVDGSTLQQLLAKHPGFLRRNLIAIWHQACMGLKYAHENGIIHRDIKPSNIMLAHDRRVKILDFGLAKKVADISQTQQVWGTPAFMAPELFQGERASFQTDIYGLGATFYMLATRQPPFTKETVAQKLVGDGLPVPPREVNGTVSKGLSETIMRCMHLDPAKRFESMDALMTRIRELGGKA